MGVKAGLLETGDDAIVTERRRRCMSSRTPALKMSLIAVKKATVDNGEDSEFAMGRCLLEVYNVSQSYSYNYSPRCLATCSVVPDPTCSCTPHCE
jgi:hypothetical protein